MTDEDHRIALLVDRLMRRVGAQLHAKGQEIDPDNVGPLGGMILTTLVSLEPAPVSRLVAEMRRDKSQMTRALRSLEAKGLITRQPSLEDKRVQLVGLSPRGRDKVKTIREVTSAIMAEILSPLSPEERQVFEALLSKL